MSNLIPESPWDSRPCLQIPSAKTCNGILPAAPADYIATHGKPPGSGLCIDLNTEHWAVPITELPDSSRIYGFIHLWWSSHCQSAFAETTSDLINSRLSATLSMDIPQNYPWLKSNKHSLITKAEGNDQIIRTPLVWGPGKMVLACGTLTLEGQIYQGCLNPQLLRSRLSPAFFPPGQKKENTQ